MGQKCPNKIASLVGRPIARMTFASVLLEVHINQEYPSVIMFENEYDHSVEQRVYYEWKLILYSKCSSFGHDLKECRIGLRDAAGVDKPSVQRNKLESDG